ncbi:MAG: hypothetical protein CMJ39_00800 [Phycisphaerae bacterium]|nr:hypothetical protein [Phycisphaerae bacterium]
MYRTLRDAEAALKPGEKIWGGYYPSGAYYFINATPVVFWRDFMMKRERLFCEVIRPSPCHMYLDIDGGDPPAIWKRLKPVLEMVYKEFGNDTLQCVEMHADSDTKKSSHIIMKGEKWCLPSPQAGLDLMKTVHRMSEEMDSGILDDDWDYIDLRIYTRNRQFRMLGCSKPGQNRPFVGIPLTYDNWYASLVQPLEDRDAVHLPTIKSTPVMQTNVPAFLQDVVMSLNIKPVRVYNPIFSWIWIIHHRGCPFVNRVHRHNNNYIVISLENGTVTYKCHHCQNRKKTVHLPTAIKERFRKMLHSNMTFTF